MISAGMALEDSSIVTALDMYEEAYNEALQVSDVELLRELHLRKGLLLLRNGLAEESIEEMYEAFHIDSLRHDTIDMMYTARYMAFAYESMGQLEHARGEISRVIHFPIIPNNSLQLGIEHDYHDRMLTLQKRLESLPSAKENEMPQITPKSTEVELAFFGWQAEQQGDVGNALSWYEKLRTKSSAAFQAFALLRMINLYLQQDRQQQALHYLDEYQRVQGQIRRQEAVTKQLLQHRARYQDRRSQSEISRLLLVNERHTYVLIFGGLVAGLLLTVLLLLVRNYRQQQVILKFKVDKLRQMREAWLNSHEDRRQQAAALEDSDINLLLRRRLNSGDYKRLAEEDWQALETAVLSFSPDFRSRLADLCRISEHDYHVCLLLKVGMKPSDIARLTNHSDEAISSTRRRLYARAFGRKGTPAEWDEVIGML